MKGQSQPNTKLDRAKDRAAEKATAKLAEARQADKTIDAAMRIGAVGAMLLVSKQFAAHIDAASIRALAHFADIEGYKQFGFDRFDDFLSKSPYSPMSRSQYYERKSLLDKEGDAAFDLLNTLRVPAAARKLLSEGKVQVEGNEVVIGESRIPVTDRDAVLEVVSTLAEKSKSQADIIERGKEKVKELKKKVGEGKLAGLLGSNPHDDALKLALVALTGLKTQAAGLSDDEAAAVRDNTMNLLRAAWSDLREAYRFGDETAVITRGSVSDEDVDSLFS
jgi:hypothetical protein